MPVLTTAARPTIAALFIAEGIDQLRSPDGRAEIVDGALTDELVERLDTSPLPRDPVELVRLNGAVQLIGGILLASNRFARLASLALVGSMVPTTYAGHRFWEEEDPEARGQQRAQFLKNLAIIGGLVMTAGGGARKRRSMRKRAKDRASAASHATAEAKDATADAARDATQRVVGTMSETASSVSETASSAADAGARRASTMLHAGLSGLAVLAGALRRKGSDARRTVRDDILPRATDVGQLVQQQREPIGRLVERVQQREPITRLVDTVRRAA